MPTVLFCSCPQSTRFNFNAPLTCPSSPTYSYSTLRSTTTMPKDSSRPSLPTSSSDFALPPSSSPGGQGSFFARGSIDDPNFLLHRVRRQSVLQRSHHSPLVNSFHARRRSQTTMLTEESESEKERMSTDSPSSSETQTPPLKSLDGSEEDLSLAKPKRTRTPLTPPRRRSSASMDADIPLIFNRRLNFPLKQPRLLKILSEPRPEEDEVKSEAAFQRLIHSASDVPRTPRPFIDRGRYPEEAGHEDTQRETTPSDDELDVDDTPFAYSTSTSTQPINIRGRGMRTPGHSATNSVAGSVAGSFNGDDQTMSISEASSGYGGPSAMDVDMAFGSPLLSSIPTALPNNSWRYTPPPTASTAVRTNKRKLDDSRFDPYPTSAKRRAVSPSIHGVPHYMKDGHSTTGSPMGRASTSRLGPISIPLSIPASTVSSATSSPTISSAYPHYPRTVNMTASPTLRAAPMLLASPIIRPIPRRRLEGEEREMEHTGQQVQSLHIAE